MSTRMYSVYQLACGAQQIYAQGKTQLTLWKEHGVYHVRAYDLHRGRLFWDSYDTLREARARFKRAIRELAVS